MCYYFFEVFFVHDCNDCLHRVNGTCYLIQPQFDCNLFVQFDFPEHQPPDNSFRSKPEVGEYPDEPVAPTITAAPIEPVPPTMTSNVRLRKGQTLFYRNKHTGEIERGKVEWAGKGRFLYHFNHKEVWLDYSVVGTRLFYTYEGASKLTQK